MEDLYKEKYLKYKNKYLELKSQVGGNFEPYKKVTINEKDLELAKDCGIVLPSVLGSKTINALSTVACQDHHKDPTDYIFTEETLKKLSLTPEFNDTILYHHFNSKTKPQLALLLLKAKCVPSKMGNFFPKELREKLLLFSTSPEIDDIIKTITDTIKTNFDTSKIGYTEVAKLTAYNGIKNAYTSLVPSLTKLLKNIKGLVNPNVKNAIKYMFLTNKYETNDVIWDHFSALLEFILCLYNCVSLNIKDSAINRVNTLKSYKVLWPFSSGLDSLIDTINSYLDIDDIKKKIETYTNQLPVSFVLLDKITSSTSKCNSFKEIYENFGLKGSNMLPDIQKKKRLEDFLIPFEGAVYIPPSVLFLLSMKLNNEALKKPDNIYLKPTNQEDINKWTNTYKTKRDADNMPIFSFYELIWTYTSEFYDLCSLKQVKETIKEVKQKTKPRGFISSLFGRKKSTNDDTQSEDNISLDSVSSVESNEINEQFLKDLQEENIELSKINNSTVVKKSIKYILDKMKLELDSLHNKICKNDNLVMSDLNKILGALGDTSGILGSILQSDLVRNSLITTMSLYTTFLPFDIIGYNIMGYKDTEKFNKYMKKYIYYELFLQDRFEKGDYTIPLNPPSSLYDEIAEQWRKDKDKFRQTKDLKNFL